MARVLLPDKSVDLQRVHQSDGSRKAQTSALWESARAEIWSSRPRAGEVKEHTLSQRGHRFDLLGFYPFWGCRDSGVMRLKDKSRLF